MEQSGAEKKERLSIDSFEMGDRLGQGRFGSVRVARHRTSGWVCAVKTLDRAEIRRHGLRDQVRMEVEVQSSDAVRGHRGLVRVWTWIEESKYLHVVMELCPGGDLWQFVRNGGVSVEKACALLVGAASGLAHLHQHGIVHRDVKAENVLLRGDGSSALADFGWCARDDSGVDDEDDDDNSSGGKRRTTLCGTLDYLSPEAVSGEGTSYPADVWALGVLLWELVCGEAPFARETPTETHRAIVSAIRGGNSGGYSGGYKGGKAGISPLSPPSVLTPLFNSVFVKAENRIKTIDFVSQIEKLANKQN